MVEDLHSFVVGSDGSLKRGAKDVAKIRWYLEGAPETKATFKLRDVSNVYPSSFKQEHIDLLGSWVFSERVRTGRERILVNPWSDDKHRFPELVEECECGSIVSRGYNDLDRLDFETEHNGECYSFYRLRLRARITERRYAIVKRLCRFGWSTIEMAPRLACVPSTLRESARKWGISIRSLQSEFRRKAGETYHYLVHELDYGSEYVADIYGYSYSTMRKWYKNW